MGLPKSVESGDLSVNKAVVRCRQNCVVREKAGDFHKRKVAHMAFSQFKSFKKRSSKSALLV